MEQTPKTEKELFKDMKFHQQEYQKLAEELKKIKAAADLQAFIQRQTERIEEFKGKYKFFTNDKAESKEIEWESLDKLIQTSLPTMSGYALGYDSSGNPGLILSQDGNIVSFDPMVEEESDCRKYAEREAKRMEYAMNAAKNAAKVKK